MSSTTKRRRAAIVAASAATTVAAVLVPTAAHAAPVQAAGGQPAAAKQSAAPRAFPTCTSWTNDEFGSFRLFVPSVGFQDNQRDCAMTQGAHSDAVFKLQRALNLCYGENLSVDSTFGPTTTAALQRAQARAGVVADGFYAPPIAHLLLFPAYDVTTSAFTGFCFNSP